MLVTDEVEGPGLPPEVVAKVAAALRAHPRVGKAWLARKRLRHVPDRDPVHVVGVRLRGSWWRLEGKERVAELSQELVDLVPLPHAFLFVEGSRTASMLRKLRRAGQRVV